MEENFQVQSLKSKCQMKSKAQSNRIQISKPKVQKFCHLFGIWILAVGA